MLDLLVEAIAVGIVVGSTYALIACGLTLVSGVLKIVNFAHGDLLMVGMYATFFLWAFTGANPYATVLVTIPLLLGLSWLFFSSVLKPVLHAPQFNQVLATLGVSIILQNGAVLLFGTDPRIIQMPILQLPVSVGPIYLSLSQLVALPIAAVISLGMYWFLGHSRLGRFIRAAAEDPDAAELMGIDVQRVYRWTFLAGAAMLGVAAPLLASTIPTTPLVGANLLLVAFAAIVIGGMGNFAGALLASLIVGVVQSVAASFIPGTLAPAITFALMILMILLRPRGLLGAVVVHG